jgi:hypothetical protein
MEGLRVHTCKCTELTQNCTKENDGGPAILHYPKQLTCSGSNLVYILLIYAVPAIGHISERMQPLKKRLNRLAKLYGIKVLQECRA